MSVRIIAVLILLASVHPLLAEEDAATPTPTPRPCILHRIVNVFHKDKAAEEARKKAKKLELTVEITPQPVKLSDGNKIQVTVRLTNKTDKFVQLEFPTTQRIEVLLRNPAGKLVTQWSEEQSFTNDPGYVTLDPNEHVEYTVTISGRDLVAGKPYTIEAFFPNYENLRVTRDFVPVR
jgi:hypothetical protein